MNTREKLIRRISYLGLPVSFGEQIASELKTEKAMDRMLGYLSHQKAPVSMEDIADEMLSICAEREAWVNKKKAEYYNAKYNAYLFEKKK